MSLMIHCPGCAKQYQVRDDLRGKRVRCQQCGNTFAIPAEANAASVNQPVYSNPLDSFGDLSQFPITSVPTSPPSASGPAGYSATHVFNSQRAGTARVSNPSGGPDDATMRLVCLGMLIFGIILGVASVALGATTGTVYLAVAVLLPLTIVLGIAGLISPDVVRAVGKYGGHLPRSYKAIGWGVMGLILVITILLIIGMMMLGFRPEQPGGRRADSQTNTVGNRDC